MNENINFKPTILILGPGGCKGFMELGVLHYLREVSHLDNIHTFVGVSVGSLISLLLICGYTIKEIIYHAQSINMFEDLTNIDLSRSIESYGLISTANIKEKLRKMVKNKLGKIPTLHELWMTTGLSYCPVSYNTTLRKAEVFSHMSHPGIDCVEATLLSMNIPFIFYQLEYNGYLYCDGGLGNPYPVDLFDDGVNSVLGIYIDSGGSVGPSFTQYIHAIIQAPMDALRSKIIRQSSMKCRHIRCETSIIDTTGSTVSTHDIVKMVMDGIETAKRYMINNSLPNIIS
jgi:predicted acylesterase/phospholipase RssA